MLLPGDPAPTFIVASSVNPKFHFETAAGRYIVLSFLGSTKHTFARQLLEQVSQSADHFDVTNVMFIGVSVDPEDQPTLKHEHNGVVYFFDSDGAVSRLYGVLRDVPPAPHLNIEESIYESRTFVLDQALRVLAIISCTGDAASHLKQIFDLLDQCPRMMRLVIPAPALIVPYVFERDLCQKLIEYYQEKGGEDSGFMREENGKTIGVKDYFHKRRSDCDIEDRTLIRALHTRLQRRLVPAIRMAYQFEVSRIERNIIACYDAQVAAHFRAHRDNTTAGTAHRRFAVSINLNAEEFEGGDLIFPEFGRRLYRPSTGGAVVFSCSLLHEVSPVISGKRYAYLPFVYDEAAARVREQNFPRVATGPPIDENGVAAIEHAKV